MSLDGSSFPFAAVVGQDLLRRALLLNAVCPALGGVLVAGDRGTAKTTAARGLAALLPRLVVVRGCPFHCDPAAVWPGCPHCQGAGERAAEEVAAPFVELPLGATEDRVAGSLDLERTLREGRPAFRPGLLAAAHRGVLYIDEVNLLADHLVDLLLDAAASGSHVVEREGVAVRHPARFVLVGTMNPAEGELRPQLADRFGLRVDVRSPTEPAQRAEVIRRRLAFEADPAAFHAGWAEEEGRLSQAVAEARSLFPSVQLTGEQIARIAAVCCAAGVEGLRADLAISRAARALAALAGRPHVTDDDLQAAAELVLPHRLRPPTPQAPPQRERPSPTWFGDRSEEDEDPADEESNGSADGPQVAAPGTPPRVPRMEVAADSRVAEPTRGRRGELPGAARGRTVRTVRDPSAESGLALDATLRAAALRGAAHGELFVQPEDLHRRVREDRRGVLVVFVVDASGSMGARRRMEAVKAAALGLLADAGRQRDEVALIAVRGARADLLLSPARDVGAAERALSRLPTGGRTPLAHGLSLAAELIHGRTPNPVLLVVVSDGKANVPLPGTDGDPWAQALSVARGVSRPGLKIVVIDAEEGLVRTDRAHDLAAALRAECLPLDTLTAASIGDVLAHIPPSAAGGPS